MNLHDAILRLNAGVATVRGDEAFDANDNPVSYDKAAAEALVAASEYKTQRARAYPPITDYLDGIVKGDQAQIDKYISDCQAVKAQFPKP